MEGSVKVEGLLLRGQDGEDALDNRDPPREAFHVAPARGFGMHSRPYERDTFWRTETGVDCTHKLSKISGTG
jgi:hypothetical protein